MAASENSCAFHGKKKNIDKAKRKQRKGRGKGR
jgi:hypothetical protein